MLKLPFNRYPYFGRDNPEYAFACGKVRALELKLLDRVRFERLSSAADFGELLKLLQDTEYSRYLNEVHKPGDFEVLLRKEYEALLQLVSELAMDSQLEMDLRFPYDFLNVKVYAKSVIFEKDFSRSYSTYSYYPASVLKDAIENGRYDLVHRIILSSFENAFSSYYEKREIFQIDVAVDKEMFKYFCSESRMEFLRVYYNLKADLQNVVTFLRLERMNRLNILMSVLLPGGYLPPSLFGSVRDFDSLLYELRHTPYYEVINPGYFDYQKNGSFVRLERDLDNYFGGLVKEASKKDLGVEPLLSYYFKKKNEISILRMIMVSKINELPKEMILERIPEVL